MVKSLGAGEALGPKVEVGSMAALSSISVKIVFGTPSFPTEEVSTAPMFESASPSAK